MLITNGNKKVIKVPCIYYLILFYKKQIKVLLNNDSKVNTINLNFAQKLSFKI